MLGNNQINQIKTVLRDHINSKYLAGANLMILRDGKEVFYHQDGLADVEKSRPIKRDSIFRLYSMSKPVTAAAVMILAERGEIDLNEPVGNYLGGFKNQMVDQEGTLIPAQREVTINDLLSMTSGLVYGGNNLAGKETMALFEEIDGRLLGDNPMGTVEAMNKLGQCPLAYQPGTSWQYGTSADALGAVIEIVSGKRFGQFLRDEIFTPLNMNDTGFWVLREKRERLVNTYSSEGDGGLILYRGNHLGIINKMDRDPAFESGGAGLVSTIDDYARFAGMLINNGTWNGTQILRQKTVEFMTSASLSAVQQKGFELWQGLSGHSYGNLMRIMTDCGKAAIIGSPGEYGWDGWLGAYFCNCPAENLTFVLLMQKKDAGTTTLTRKLRNIVISSINN